MWVDWTVTHVWLYTGLQPFTPEASQAGSNVDSTKGEHPKEVCCKRCGTPRTCICKQMSQPPLSTLWNCREFSPYGTKLHLWINTPFSDLGGSHQGRRNPHRHRNADHVVTPLCYLCRTLWQKCADLWPMQTHTAFHRYSRNSNVDSKRVYLMYDVSASV